MLRYIQHDNKKHASVILDTKRMIKLSVIILSYNTKDITRECIEKLYNSLSSYPLLESEIVLVDNASVDGSIEMIKSLKSSLPRKNIGYSYILNKQNEGFPKGNNAGIVNAKGDYILFLNSDVLIRDIDWPALLSFLDNDPTVAALTVRVNLPKGGIDPASHRGFPTVWNSFCYYSKLEALTRNIPILNTWFGGYHMTEKDLTSVHEVDAISGAFFLARKRTVNELGGFDETFFMYGEDIDLAYRMKEKGYKVVYYPKYHVTHLKYQSGLKKGKKNTENKTKKYFYDAMKIFYRKHYEEKNPWIVSQLVYFFINVKSRL